MERLGGRYEVHTPLASGHGRTVYEGHDDVLQSPVGLLVLDRDHPHAAEVRDAARRAAAVDGPHLQRILDVDVDDGRVFVVTRWSSAHTLADLLGGEPLPPREAAVVVAEVADALSAGHAAGLYHLRLDPRDVLVGDRTQDGTTLTGLGVRAALSPRDDDPVTDADRSRADTRRLGAVLYATLTGRWPDGPCAGLPGAPQVADRPARPRQVRAGVPAGLDVVTCRALGMPGEGAPLDDPADLSAALRTWTDQPVRPQAEPTADPSGLPRGAWVALAAVAGVLAVGVLLLGWTVVQDRRAEPVTPGPTPTSAGAGTGSITPTPGTPHALAIASAVAFDPQGDGEENDDTAPLAIDGDLGTAWTTLTYATRPLGGLKDGVGLQLRLARTSEVEGVDLQLVGKGSDLQVYTASGAPSSLKDYRLAAEVLGAGDRLTLRFAPPKTADTVLIWLTGLPATADGYQGGISEAVVRGTPVR